MLNTGVAGSASPPVGGVLAWTDEGDSMVWVDGVTACGWVEHPTTITAAIIASETLSDRCIVISNRAT